MPNKRPLDNADGYHQPECDTIGKTNKHYRHEYFSRNVRSFVYRTNVSCKHAQVHDKTTPYRDTQPYQYTVIAFSSLDQRIK